MKRILIISMGIFVCFNFIGCAQKNSSNKKQSTLIQKKQSMEISTETGKTVQEEDVFYDEPQYAMEDNILAYGAEIVYDDISYQILEIERTNKFGDHKKENLSDAALFWTDENGNLSDNNQYIFLKLRFTNKAKDEREIYRNTGQIIAMSQEREIFPTGGDVVYMDPLWENGEQTAVYHYVLKPNESVESELGYLILPDEFHFSASDELFYMIGDTSEYGDLENQYVRLEE